MKYQHAFAITMCLLFGSSAMASSLTIPNTFSANTPAVADEVNANFTATKAAVDDNDSRTAALEAALADLQATVTAQADSITALQADLAAANTTITAQAASISALETDVGNAKVDILGINNSSVMALAPYLVVDTVSDVRGPLGQLSGVNLQIISGSGATGGTPNGLGNLIIGYDTERLLGVQGPVCSSGLYTNQTDCENNGNTWAVSHKSGSHYLVIGDENNYSQYGGIVSGFHNTASREYASVLGGKYNFAFGYLSVVSGGELNFAAGQASSVSGGYNNWAAGNYASVSGGVQNNASGIESSVSSGYRNNAIGWGSSVSGGIQNNASGSYSSISGGFSNGVSGNYGSILGGQYQTISIDYQTIPALP